MRRFSRVDFLSTSAAITTAFARCQRSAQSGGGGGGGGRRATGGTHKVAMPAGSSLSDVARTVGGAEADFIARRQQREDGKLICSRGQMAGPTVWCRTGF